MNDEYPECCPSTDLGEVALSALSDDFDDELALFAKALAHPARVHILRALLER